jgi:hypothetical protein
MDAGGDMDFEGRDDADSTLGGYSLIVPSGTENR